MFRSRVLSGYKKCGATSWSKDDKVQVIDISGGYEAKVDKWYYEKNCLFTWFVSGNYFCRRDGDKIILMHRDVLSVDDSCFEVDHINGDTFDNRECNLRVCTHKENSRNTKKQYGTTSIFKGVVKKGKKWIVQITKDGKSHCLGTHIDEVTAALVYDSAAVYLFGEFAKINFPLHKEKLLEECRRVL